MVYRRKRTYRKKITRKRTYRRRFSKRTRMSKRGQRLYLFKRWVNLGILNVDSTLGLFDGFSFRLNDLPNVSEFITLYDSYKLNAVKIRFIPQMTENVSLSTVNNPQNVRFFSVIDYSDASTPLSLDDLRQYQSCKMTSIFRTHQRYIYKPKILDASSSSRSSWIATSAPSTLHYGLKIGVENTLSSVSTQMAFRVEATYYMSFKQVK